MSTRGPKPIQQLDDIAKFLRDKGKTYREIGSILSVSKERAWARVHRGVNKKEDDPQKVIPSPLDKVNRIMLQ